MPDEMIRKSGSRGGFVHFLSIGALRPRRDFPGPFFLGSSFSLYLRIRSVCDVDREEVCSHRLHQEAWLFPPEASGSVFHASGERDSGCKDIVSRCDDLRRQRFERVLFKIHLGPGVGCF